MILRSLRATILGWLLLLWWPASSLAQTADRCTEAIARIVSVQGTVELQETGSSVWRAVALDGLLCPGDTVQTGERSRAAILAINSGSVLRVDQNTTLRLREPPATDRSLLDLLLGAVNFLSREPQSIEVHTPFVNAGIEGTEFSVDVGANQAEIIVANGKVLASKGADKITLVGNESVLARAGQPLERRLVARPGDAVQWALYYRPVLPISGPGPGIASAGLRRAVDAWRDGDLSLAFERLDGVAAGDRDPWFHLYRAGLLLTVGRHDEAAGDLDAVPDSAPAAAGKYALLTVIAIARNETAEALAHGHSAVELDPDSAAARIALSYALQAQFQLEAARDILLEGIDKRPEDALTWARVAELWLALGDSAAAIEAAETAARLAPGLSRTQTVLGFAALARARIDDAKTAFERAIALDSADPLARLGLGLARIRDGDLGEGRQDIEVAAALDRNDALVRSYLGKAYFEERRDLLAAEQFDLAKELDPKDPTPWFYDAIRKQTENRPVEALHDLQRSIELNDNRAVYRSRLLLDEDLSARSAGIARIYNDLEFSQLALLEGWKSANVNPGNYSAHRLLADSYAALPRHQIARVSELLQSQLRQPLNVTPIQPQLGQSNLFILEGAGPTTLSFNEFNPLFASDGVAVQFDGVAGNHDVLGEDFILSAVAGNFSLSAGQFHFESDGIRTNNDQEQNIYNIFGQLRLSPDTSVQAELRMRDFERGDLQIRFDPDNFSPTLRQDDKVESARIGFHHRFSPRFDVIANVSVQGADFDTLFPGASELNLDETAYTGEIQALYQGPWFDVTAGGGHVVVDRVDTLTGFDPPFGPFAASSQVNHTNLYAYSKITPTDDLDVTLGVSADLFTGGTIDKDQVNPKVGIIWSPFAGTTLRAAAFRTFKRTLISDQTIEPTQVAGFNQFFDDIEGSDAWRYGGGFDQVVSPDVFIGGEYSRRDLDVPGTIPGPMPAVVLQSFEEQFARAYLYWTVDPRWTLSAEYQYEQFIRSLALLGPEDFTELDTHRLSLGAGYHHPSGLSAKIKGTYVHQDGMFGDAFAIGTVVPGSDSFWVLDTTLEYRFPKRHGSASLVLKNAFGDDFKFQDTDPASPRIIPERQILFRLNLFF